MRNPRPREATGAYLNLIELGFGYQAQTLTVRKR